MDRQKDRERYRQRDKYRQRQTDKCRQKERELRIVQGVAKDDDKKKRQTKQHEKI